MIPFTFDCSKVVSYNCRGWKSGSNYVQSLLQSCDICLVQEHWLLRENLDSLIISDDFLFVGVSRMDSSILLTGYFSFSIFWESLWITWHYFSRTYLTTLSLLVIIMLTFLVLGPIALIYPRSCYQTISFLFKSLALTLPTIMMIIHAFPLLITFLLIDSVNLTMLISLILFLFLILLIISQTTYPYTLFSSFLTFTSI